MDTEAGVLGEEEGFQAMDYTGGSLPSKLVSPNKRVCSAETPATNSEMKNASTTDDGQRLMQSKCKKCFKGAHPTAACLA